MPPNRALSRASWLTRAWLCAVTIRSVPSGISEATTSFGSACTVTLIPAARAAAPSRSSGAAPPTPPDFGPVLAQHVQGRHAEMAGADESDPHNVSSVLSQGFPSITCRADLSPTHVLAGGVINRGGKSPYRPEIVAGGHVACAAACASG